MPLEPASSRCSEPGLSAANGTAAAILPSVLPAVTLVTDGSTVGAAVPVNSVLLLGTTPCADNTTGATRAAAACSDPLPLANAAGTAAAAPTAADGGDLGGDTDKAGTVGTLVLGAPAAVEAAASPPIGKEPPAVARSAATAAAPVPAGGPAEGCLV